MTVARALLETGNVVVNKRSYSGRTAVSYAAGACRPDVVRMLVGESGADVNARDHDGKPPLWWTGQIGKAEMEEIMNSLGATM